MNSKLRKEFIDQPLHFLWAAGSTMALFAGGWWIVGALSWMMIVSRECWQKRDERWGIFGNFPWLDATFYALGGVAGAAIGALCF